MKKYYYTKNSLILAANMVLAERRTNEIQTDETEREEDAGMGFDGDYYDFFT